MSTSPAQTASITVAPLSPTTTYIVTATTANGCTRSTGVNVTINTLPTPNITGATTACGSVKLTASGGNTYVWSNGGGNAAMGAFNTAGPYIVTVTATTNGCTATATRSITVKAAPTNITLTAAPSISPTIGTPLSLTSAVTPLGTYAYAWTGPSSFVSTATAPQVTTYTIPSNGGAYTVTVTNTTTSCTKTASITVTPVCVPATGVVSIPDGTLANTGYFNQTANQAATHFVVPANATITLNPGGSINLSGKTFIMGAGSKIQVLSATLTNTTFLSCAGVMWQGIEFAPGGNGLSLNNCKIYNALTAIKVTTQTISITNTLFDQNNCSIHINGTPTAFVCTGNRFECTTTGIAALNNEYPEYGIRVEDFDEQNPLLIGTATVTAGLRNTFKRLQRGIWVKNASVTISHCNFEDILPYDSEGLATIYNSTRGRAIFAEAQNFAKIKHLVVERGTSIIPNCNFTNCAIGVYADNTTLKVRNNTFSGGTVGAKAVFFTNIDSDKPVNIVQNNISAYTYGIDAFNNLSSPSLIVSNIIQTAKANAIGIRINEAVSNISTYTLNANTITLSGTAVDGISINNVTTNSSISNNTINIDAPAVNRSGIALTNSRNLNLDCNTITNTTGNRATYNTLTYSPIGLRLTGVTESKISCTRTNNTYTGIKIEGTCTNSILQGTEFNNHTRGLWVFGGGNTASNGVIGDQVHRGNKWLNNATLYPNGSNTLYGAYYGDNNAPAVANPSFRFKYDLVNQSDLKPNNLTHSSLWFVPLALNIGETTYTCPTCTSTGSGGSGAGTGGNITAPTNPDFSTEEIAIAENSVDFGTYENVAKWEAQKNLYEKVDNYNGVIVEGSPIDVFRDSVATTEIADFAETDKATKAVFDVPSALKSAYNSHKIVFDNYLQTYTYLDSLYQNATDSLQQAGYATQMQAIKAQIVVTEAQLSQIQTQIEADRDLKIDDALALNALLEEGEVYQYNQKTVTDIYLSTLAKGRNDLSASDLANIDIIAHQCPYAGGKAVYEARSIYALVSDEIYDDHAICAAVGINARIANSNTSAAKSPPSGNLGGVRLFPNPTTGIARLYIPAEYQGSEIIVTNVVGQVLIANLANTTIQSIDLSAEAEGVYFITLRKEGKLIYQSKIVKIE